MSSAAQEQPPEPADGGPEPGVHRAHITGAHITGRVVSASAVFAATPEQLFALLADPHRHHELDGSGSVRGLCPDRGGYRFGMRMRVGRPYQTMNKMVELEPDRRIAWCHFARAIWRYELEPVDGGALVTETFDYGGSPFARGLELVGSLRATPGRSRPHSAACRSSSPPSDLSASLPGDLVI